MRRAGWIKADAPKYGDTEWTREFAIGNEYITGVVAEYESAPRPRKYIAIMTDTDGPRKVGAKPTPTAAARMIEKSISVRMDMVN